jgi:hypothetical protein
MAPPRGQEDRHIVARGWESKAIESQQEAAADARRAGPSVGLPAEAPGAKAGDPGRQAAHATLMLARTRAMADLQSACAPAHRAMLEQAIADLDQRIAALKT